jgi:hypothetical protein
METHCHQVNPEFPRLISISLGDGFGKLTPQAMLKILRTAQTVDVRRPCCHTTYLNFGI